MSNLQHLQQNHRQAGKQNLLVPNKVIMVMGAIGSGKTTLINGMINYVLGVQWEDEFRFKLIHEITNRSQAQSQTSAVTAYEVNYKEGFQVPYSLTIIDTPGFGDTRGIDHDKEITRQIREFFSTTGAIDHIDAICIVVQSSLARLTHAQKYVFDSVLSIFGKDIKDNIQILITFADGQTPPVLEAIKESDVPCSKDVQGMPVHFKFNNSALFASNAGTAAGSFTFDEMFWKMGAMSMKTFFDSLGNLETKSLTLTKEVLRERKALETAVEALQPQIKAGLMKLEELRKTQEALEQHRDDMEANKDFEYEWDVHFNQKYRWDYEVVKEKQTYAQLKEKYEKASGEVMTTEKIFEQIFQEYAKVEEIVRELIERSSHSLQRLQEIALKPKPLSTPEHIDLLIMSEEQEAKPGYQERIKSLCKVRETAVIITQIANKEELLPVELEVEDVLDAIMLPREIAVMHCAAHTNATDDISQGNRQADYAAKEAALQPLPQEIIPRFGLPLVVNSDQGSHFTEETLNEVKQELYSSQFPWIVRCTLTNPVTVCG
ncbi:uncharacterized protein [Emydura macquarii macquarii]|uniref:uncharacterized protein n=1 Tax=Emydura macquarii macquarii TaxID=1129001 RepID=UPI00352AF3F4